MPPSVEVDGLQDRLGRPSSGHCPARYPAAGIFFGRMGGEHLPIWPDLRLHRTTPLHGSGDEQWDVGRGFANMTSPKPTQCNMGKHQTVIYVVITTMFVPFVPFVPSSIDQRLTTDAMGREGRGDDRASATNEHNARMNDTMSVQVHGKMVHRVQRCFAILLHPLLFL